MKIATWNLNHRAGSSFTPYLPEAAKAIGSLPVEVLVLTEYFPKERGSFSPSRHDAFVADLVSCGFRHCELSIQTREKANRILVASRRPLEIDSLPLPDIDEQFPANVLAIFIPSAGMRLLGTRVPYYQKKSELGRLSESWDWLESAANALIKESSVIIGDLIVSLGSSEVRGGKHFRRILESGWARAEPTSGSSFPIGGSRGTEIDHALCSPSLGFASASYLSQAGGFAFAGADGALSDHAVLVVEVVTRRSVYET